MKRLFAAALGIALSLAQSLHAQNGFNTNRAYFSAGLALGQPTLITNTNPPPGLQRLSVLNPINITSSVSRIIVLSTFRTNGTLLSQTYTNSTFAISNATILRTVLNTTNIAGWSLGLVSHPDAGYTNFGITSPQLIAYRTISNTITEVRQNLAGFSLTIGPPEQAHHRGRISFTQFYPAQARALSSTNFLRVSMNLPSMVLASNYTSPPIAGVASIVVITNATYTNALRVPQWGTNVYSLPWTGRFGGTTNAMWGFGG